MAKKISINSIFNDFSKLNVLVIGDVMIDSYIWGKVERISPEAPVPVVNVKKREFRLGGAANVALNIQALGAKPIICSVIGDDRESEIFDELLKARKISSSGIVKSSERITTFKERIISGSQQMLRVDSENDTILTEKENKKFLSTFDKLAKNCQVIILEDYDKGVFTKQNIAYIIKKAKSLTIPVIVDPKKRNFTYFNGATIFKPNLKELREGLKIEISANDDKTLLSATSKMRKEFGFEGVFLTLSEHGVLLDYNKEKIRIPAHLRSITDVSGAGDTVVSIAAMCLALNLPGKIIAGLANLGGGIVCEEVGVVPINKNRLKTEAEKVFSELK
jgi:D-glycero-beta-D-manno-heptose-7-phosphate kinase